jgi:hypothetical protein
LSEPLEPEKTLLVLDAAPHEILPGSPSHGRTARRQDSGLVVTWLLVELDGGQLTVSSTAGHASIFSSSSSASEATPEAAPPEGASGPEPHHGGAA